MTGNEYQRKAMRTATLKCFDPANAALGLTGEASEKRVHVCDVSCFK